MGQRRTRIRQARAIKAARRTRVPAWRWATVIGFSLFIAIAAARSLIGQEAEAVDDSSGAVAPASAEETRLMPEGEVAQKRPARRLQVQAQYEQYLLRRLNDAPPPEPVADIEASLNALPAELRGHAPAEDVQ